ncbi:hypothetical protein F518_02782 [Serratia marcescens VGH107]|nr:hypothetical protein F518_02782 [Serratia marcescens VGH107]
MDGQEAEKMEMWIFVQWLSLGALLLGGMILTAPSAIVRRTEKLRPCVWRFLCGDMKFWGTLWAGLGLSGVGWWCHMTALLPPAQLSGLLMVGGGMVLIALFNVGRRTTRFLGRQVVLAGIQAAGWELFMLTALQYCGFSVW